ncbi:MAG TPA: peptide-N4-asparagine amidase, partial [Candidatus Eremiobacteraceae bacterium]|nr:peptide-N4-asparagine amidase [Candidatus Eremiobacteraceae bacterium]
SYDVDLDAWAGVLSDGNPHTIGVTVYDDRGDWPIDGNLMLWTDPHAQRTSGAVVADTIESAVPMSSSFRSTADGDRFWLTASRSWQVSGFVDTSAGRVWHTVTDRMRFWNLQLVDLATGLGDATQTIEFETTTMRRQAGRTSSRDVTTSYPLVVDATYPPPQAMKPYVLVIDALVRQGLHERALDGSCDASADATAVLKRLSAHVDAIAHGHTVESNSCTGSFGDFAIRRSAIDGTLVTH